MRAVADTSVIVAALLSENTAHAECVQSLASSDAAAAGHAWFESLSVLTRLPADVRLNTADAHRALTATIGGARLVSSAEQRAFQRWLATSAISGGAIYDALVGWAARSARVPLITRDLRALPTYRALGIELLLVEPSLH